MYYCTIHSRPTTRKFVGYCGACGSYVKRAISAPSSSSSSSLLTSSSQWTFNKSNTSQTSPTSVPSIKFSSSTYQKKNLSPGEAGKAAFELRNQLEQQRANERTWERTKHERSNEERARGLKNDYNHDSYCMSTLLSHAGLSSSEKNLKHNNFNSPLAPPIVLSTTYERPPDGNYGEDGWIYSREGNPTRKLLEDVVAELEMAGMEMVSATDTDSSSPTSAQTSPAKTYAFSSGMSAVASLLLSHPSHPSSPVKVFLPTDVYHGVPTQLHASLNDHGVVHEALDMTDLEEIRERLSEEIEQIDEAMERRVEKGGKLANLHTKPSVIVWMETPSNPLCQVTDIRAVCDVVNELRNQKHCDENVRITTVVDSTWAPPCITQPLLLGADAVLHSGTKYLSGHSDALLGLVTTSPLTPTGRWLSPRLQSTQSSIGAVPSPFESSLTLRGLRTLI